MKPARRAGERGGQRSAPSHDSDSGEELEDGEVPLSDDEDGPPRKQRKLETHGRDAPDGPPQHGGARRQQAAAPGGRSGAQRGSNGGGGAAAGAASAPGAGVGRERAQQSKPGPGGSVQMPLGARGKAAKHTTAQNAAAAAPGGGGGGGSAAAAIDKQALKARLESLLSSDGPLGAAAPRGPADGQPPQPGAALGRGAASPAAAKYVAEVYKDASPSVEVKARQGGDGAQAGGNDAGPTIKLADVQGLVLWVLSSNNIVEAPRWAFVKNKPLVSGVVLVLANGLSAAMMQEKRHLLPFLSSLGRAATVTTSPQAKPASSTAELLTSRLTLKNVKRKRAEQQNGAAEQQNGAADDGDGGGGDAAAGSKPEPAPASAAPRSGPFPPSHYVATLEQLRAHNYPLPSLNGDGSLVCPPGFVATRPSGDSANCERMVAVDCEMCITEAGFELTRLTLVAGPGWPGAGPSGGGGAADGGSGGGSGGGGGGKTWWRGGGGAAAAAATAGSRHGAGSGNGGRAGGGGAAPCVVLLDELVLPERPITDYNTRYSGITAAMLQGCTTRLEDVRERFLALVPAEALLVGHGLENDLKALRTCHSRVLDTALLFPHPKGPPFKSALKILARRFLKRAIQDGSHDSVVDAQTALDLVLLRVKHGPTFGAGGSGPHSAAPKLSDILSAHCGASGCLVDRPDVLQRYVAGSVAAIAVASDDDAVAKAGRQASSGTYGFVWTQLTELSTFLFRRARHACAAASARPSHGSADTGTSPAAGSSAQADGGRAAAPDRPEPEPAGNAAARPDAGPDFSDAALDRVLASYDRRLRSLFEALPPRCMLVVATGAGDTGEYDRQYELKCKRCSKGSDLPPWTEADERALVELAAREMQGLCWARVA